MAAPCSTNCAAIVIGQNTGTLVSAALGGSADDLSGGVADMPAP
ncbi:hypothetical protein PATSB16_19380 [Pandoraea thiooxydans]|nr:hypothetical protein PATSB16_19380 [Pandoraea thiooxydans]